MIIQHNIAAINSYRNLGINQSGLSKNLEKLSSGYKINRAGDDAAGLAISESMRSQINGLNQASKNAEDAIGLIQTAEGALTEVHSMLQRLTTLASQAANGTYNTVARGNLQSEVDELLAEIDRIANNTDFNGIKPLADIQNGNAGVMTFQIGPSRYETIKVTAQPMTVFGIDAAIRGIKLTAGNAALKNGLVSITNGGKTKIDASMFQQKTTTAQFTNSVAKDKQIDTTGTYKNQTGKIGEILKDAGLSATKNTGIASLVDMQLKGSVTNFANDAIDTINKAINEVSSFRAKLGAAQNRLEHTVNNLKVTSENITAAESRIRDTDMADEITAFTKNNILLQASQSMLAQSNSVPQGVLSLLQ
ncbi:flagellin [bacterium 1XD42-94]|nr:flagellin [bacterium 1XD42-76]NBK03948.1 flagellin [bacterium 1XD42-94]